jgi:hypothetical protein
VCLCTANSGQANERIFSSQDQAILVCSAH